MLAILESGLAADGDVSNIRIRRVVRWVVSGLSIHNTGQGNGAWHGLPRASNRTDVLQEPAEQLTEGVPAEHGTRCEPG